MQGFHGQPYIIWLGRPFVFQPQLVASGQYSHQTQHTQRNTFKYKSQLFWIELGYVYKINNMRDKLYMKAMSGPSKFGAASIFSCV